MGEPRPVLRDSADQRSMPTVAMVGGGQLARMTQQAAIGLGQCLRVLATSQDDPAAQVSPDVVVGSHTDLEALRTAARGAAALTFDHEGAPVEHLRTLQDEGVVVLPPPQALIYAQDKLRMRVRLAELGVPVPDFADLSGTDRDTVLAEFGARHDWQVVLKTVRGGYDGRGVWVLDNESDARAVLAEVDGDLLVEQRVPMRRELSAMIARSPFGQGAAWPVVETVQRHGQCAVAIAPAPGLDPSTAEAAEHLALRLAAELGVVGVMAVELFEKESGALSVNELAMRPHNSGHWTMDGAVTDQFEQHLRAVLDYPLGATSARAPVTVMANILGAEQTPTMTMDERLHHLMARIPEARVHLYGKGERPDRKIGHVNIVGTAGVGVGAGSPDDEDYVAAIRERAERAATWMSTAVWTDGWDPHDEH
ncbi:5-(carboxyamino)imidazole ribonucleotide synthase [Williamsia sterculiae]|uniref:N5-carboxyaminoimidazole ribonucleotide synthase n=2 Tax=Williamsia sterculiae TaxID=1344003 RepID=A0A1N7E054_9NOCA|nr:5-(carboxyamino)imidazole ribonucleotide synthase [Williamsia sterculiae]